MLLERYNNRQYFLVQPSITLGVQEILNTLVELAPAPKSRTTIQREVFPSEKNFSAVVFKIQANRSGSS
jgi:peptide subunit release factor RF-3